MQIICRRWPWVAVVAAAVVTLGAVAPKAMLGQAQPLTEQFACDACGVIDGLHSFWNVFGCTEGPDCYDCHALNACHGNGQPGECWQYHLACGVTEGLIDHAKQAAGEGGLASSDASYRVPVKGKLGAIYVNRARRLVQVMNCTGEVVAQFSLRRVALRAL